AGLLSLMSFLDRQGIPDSLLVDDNEDPMDFEDAMAVLLAFSLVVANASGNSYDIHRLAQLATRAWLTEYDKSGEEKWASEALILLSLRFPIGQYENWATCASQLPHAEMV